MAPAPEFDARRRLLTLPFGQDTCLRDTLEAAARIMEGESWSEDCSVLLDCTGARTAGLTENDLEVLDRHFVDLEEDRTPGKLAFLIPPDPAFLGISLLHHKLLTSRPRLQVGAFLSKAAAVAWLTQPAKGRNGNGDGGRRAGD